MSDCLTQPVSKLVMYKCRLDFNAFIIRSPAPSPPLNVQATQASASAPVEVSWSPPSGGAATITGYRIFYGNGESILVPSIITGISLALNGSYIGQSVSLHSEFSQLSSELINVTVTAAGKC